MDKKQCFLSKYFYSCQLRRLFFEDDCFRARITRCVSCRLNVYFRKLRFGDRDYIINMRTRLFAVKVNVDESHSAKFYTSPNDSLTF